jgi:hypothetical protein
MAQQIPLETSTELKKITNRNTDPCNEEKMSLYLIYEHFPLQRSIFNCHLLLQSRICICKGCNF